MVCISHTRHLSLLGVINRGYFRQRICTLKDALSTVAVKDLVQSKEGRMEQIHSSSWPKG